MSSFENTPYIFPVAPPNPGDPVDYTGVGPVNPRHYGRAEDQRPPEKVQHFKRPERYQYVPAIMCVDPPNWVLKLPYTPRDIRRPSSARIETLDVSGGDSVTFWTGREPSRMDLTIGFDAALMGQANITEELAFLRRVTGPGPNGKGIRVQLNFGEAQDQMWWVESVDITHKERRGSEHVVSALAEVHLVQAVSPVLAFTPGTPRPAEAAAQAAANLDQNAARAGGHV